MLDLGGEKVFWSQLDHTAGGAEQRTVQETNMVPPFPKEEQVKSHETKFKTMSAELLEHRSSLPEKKVKGKEYEELKQKEEYLEFEVNGEVSPSAPSPSAPLWPS